MKFQKLTIHNIASIEDAVIDFEAQPLADSDVFLITGKTGAGKSTILDAICLALYANTPRMKGTNMQGNTEDGEDSLTIKDPRQLMRRNTSEASVSLTFIGSNEVHYEAVWSVYRADKKVTGKIQQKKWKLKDLDAGYTYSKDEDIKPEIRAAIGLDFDQFCRTTLLAQGEFTRFLNSNNNEKAEILEKITGVDVYSRIGAKVYKVTGQKEQLKKEAKLLVESTHILTNEEIAKKRETLSVLDDKFKEIKSDSEKDVAKRDWLTKDAELRKNKNKAADDLRIAKEAIENEDFKKQEQNVKDWNTTIDVRLWMNEVKEAIDEQERQEKALNELAVEYSKLCGGHKFEEAEFSKIAKEIKRIDDFISTETDKACVYEKAQTIVGHLNTIESGRQAIKKNKSVIELKNRQLADNFIPVYEEAKANAQKAKEALEIKESEVKSKEEAVTELNLPELRAKIDEAKDLLGKVVTANERIETLTSVKLQYEDTRKSLDGRKLDLDQKINQSKAKEAPIHDAKIKMDVCKNALDKQSDTINKFASTLRTKLRVGDICPVCRQEIKLVLPKEDVLASLVSELKKAYENAEKEYNVLFEAKVKLDAEIKTDSEAYKRELKAFNEDKTVANAEQKATDACKVCGLDICTASKHIEWNTVLSELSILKGTTTNAFNELDAQIKAGEKCETEVKKLRSVLESERKNVETLAAKVAEAEKNMSECKGEINTAEALVKTKNVEIENAIQKASELIVGCWQINWKESPKEFADNLISSAEDYNNKVQKKQTLSSAFETTKANLGIVQKVLTSILSSMPSWTEREPDDVVKVEDILTKANNLNTSVATALSKLKAAEERLNTNQAKLHGFLSENSEINLERLEALNGYSDVDISSMNDSLKSVRDVVIAKQTLFENAEKEISDHKSKKPEYAEQDTLDELYERIDGFDKEIADIAEKKGAINQELKTDNANRIRLGKLIIDADKKEADYKKWDRLNQLIGDATGQKFRKIAQSYVLTNLINSANSYMKMLTNRYTLKVTPGTFVITLEDAYQGFVSRAASTISGGESFLVSLSLALALSDISQKLSVDTLFIDEGFGTLSGEPLQNAINTLRSLHTKAGRHVGIISHVEELQERIPVQIQVNQEGNNSSSKVIIVPESSTCS